MRAAAFTRPWTWESPQNFWDRTLILHAFWDRLPTTSRSAKRCGQIGSLWDWPSLLAAVTFRPVNDSSRAVRPLFVDFRSTERVRSAPFRRAAIPVIPQLA